MIGENVVAKVFGTKNDREIKRLGPPVQAINALEAEMRKLSDEQLRAKTEEFRRRIQERLSHIPEEPPGDADPDLAKQAEQARAKAVNAALDEILVEAFAVVREGGRRVLNMRHFDVQLIGGMVLHHGKIAEMKTGEGKTLVATLPVYLNALGGRGVHVITVNDYLAKRDSEWMGQLYRFLGLSVGVIVHDLDDAQRREAYAADVTYGTNNEFGFDYLRDNMKFDLRDCVQRGHNYAIVDEVDSILIDEARTPLIISGASEESTDKYAKVNRIIPKLEKGEEIDGPPGEAATLTGDYVVDEKHKNITVTDEGWEKVEGLLGIGNIADPENWDLKHHVEVAVKAHSLYHRDVAYVVKDGEVIIVDEFTGRLMPGRRWSDGLHQAVEAKENVKIERENQTLATITFQNYFRMYKKLAGMTGTAETEATEFEKIYRLEVMVIPTNREMRRLENADVVFRTEKEKYYAASDEIQKLNQSGQPVLVGTTSIEKSERLSDLLKKKGVKHSVLNAKQHEREAEIVAQAGRKGMVTIATNMAGRGTDILLGGNPEFMAKVECVKKGLAQPLRAAQGKIQISVDESKSTVWYYGGNEYVVPTEQWTEIFNRHKEFTDKEHDEVIAAGGLHILGTERHESRRIDNQLRGRAGRQGDPGSSRFYLSLEDDLMRIFAKEWVSNLLQRLGMEEGIPIESKLMSRRIESAQKTVEAQNFESRKHLLEYDDVMNKQREAVYGLRRQLLSGVDQKELILEDYVSSILSNLLDQYCAVKVHADDWDIKALKDAIFTRFGVDILAEGHQARDPQPPGTGRRHLRDAQIALRCQGKTHWPGRHALSRAHDHAERARLAMERPPSGYGPPEGGHRASRLRPARSAGRVQARILRHVRSHDAALSGRGGSISLSDANPGAAAGGRRGIGAGRDSGPGTAGPDAGVPVPRLGGDGNGHRPQRAVATSVDDLEEAFQRKKRRELEHARMAGSGDQQPVQQVVRGAAKIGRNDPCPCGSGKEIQEVLRG